MTKEPDPHFGPEDEMRAWAAREDLELIYEDEDSGIVDWHAVYRKWIERLDRENRSSDSLPLE